ncbi:two-partner secretion domain-containing protein [Coleofasciculus sp. E2-BRE-01]|uniref:two-partner secretion domain-containing protein n=1 Tax=Coleofasciculus sp. E2-BRE-01 TaxID=3069524 RepID=UPI0032FED88C
MKIIKFLKQGRTLTLPLIWLTLFNPTVQAQLIPDNTLGTENSIVSPQGARDLIEGGAKRGSNLFHSFTEFNVNLDQQVYFANPDGIANILTRVTGDNLSNIFGTLGVDGNANLFLLNPNGILFGVDAKLDVAGSFVASTADGIQLGDDGMFRATNPQDSQLLAIQPGVLFLDALRQQQAEIRNQGQLTVATGQTLTLAGDRVISTGSLTAPGGTIQVFGEEVQLLETARIDVSSLTGGGSVTIGQGEQVTIAENVQIQADSLNQGDGGSVIIRGNETTQFEGTITARGASDTPQSNGGFVDVSGGYLEFTGIVDTTAPLGDVGTLLLDPKNILIQADGSDPADGQTFETNPTEVSIINGNVLGSALATNSVTLQANNDIAINQSLFSPSSNSLTLQAGRSITIANGQLIFLIGGDFIAKINDENAIASQRDAGVAQFLMNPDSTLTSLGGRIEITSGTFADTSQINTANSTISSADVLGNSGSSGDITLFALGNVTTGIVNTGRDIIGDVVANNGGNITIKSENGAITTTDFVTSDGLNQGGNILLEAGGNLSVNENILSTSTEGIGGNITLNSENGAIATSAMLISDSLNQAGDISVDASEKLDINGNISSRGEIGGNITLNSDNGAIATTASLVSQGINQAGDISVEASENLDIDGNIDSSGEIAGGNITLNSENGAIATTAPLVSNGSNQAGDILLNASENLSVNRNIRSEGEIGGNITLNSENGGITTTAPLVSNGSNQAGNILLNASENLSVNRNISSRGEIGGNITLKSENGGITTTASLVSQGSNQAGDISVEASENLDIEGNIDSSGEIAGGNITLNSENGAIATTASLVSDGVNQAGDISVDAAGDLNTMGNIIANSENQAGDISLNAIRDVSVNRNISAMGEIGGNITLKSENGGITTTAALVTNSLNQGGDISVEAHENLSINQNIASRGEIGGNITLKSENGAIATTAALVSDGSNQAGDISVDAAGDLNTMGNIVANSENQAGDISLNAIGDLSVNKTIASDGNFAGQITLNSGGLFWLRGNSITNSGRLPGIAKGITITAQSIRVEDGSIFSFAFNEAQGGMVQINAADDIVIRNSNIGTAAAPVPGSAEMSSADAGDINLNTRRLTIIQDPETTFPFGVGVGSSTDLSNSGNAGNVTINATESIEIIGNQPGAFNPNPVELAQIPLQGDTGISTSASGRGNSGNLIINTGRLSIRDGGGITTFVKQGEGGDLTVNATDVFLQGEGGIGTGTLGEDAGDLTLTAENVTLTDGALISTSTGGDGNAGDLTLDVRNLSIRNGAGVLGNTGADGNGGQLTIKNAEFIEVIGRSADGSFPSSIATDLFSPNESGNAGDIDITSQDLIVQQGGEITSATRSFGDGGTIRLNLESLQLNNSRINASTSRSGKGGNIQIRASESIEVIGAGFDALQEQFVRPAFADTLTLDNFSQGIVTVTDGEGRAGNVFIETPNFIARDGGLIATTTLNQGRGGNIQIDATNQIELDNSLLGSGTFDQAASGNVTLTSPQLVARGGAQVLTTTFNSGQAGDLNVNVSESIKLSDPNNQGTLLGTGLFASSTQSASGDGGDININSPTSELNIRDRAAVSVSATGTGNAGDINIDVRSLFLDQGLISATSLSGEGGNINLKVAEIFILRNNSQLSTRAGTADSGGGNGGDLTVDANFIVGVLSENSDITANAFEGNGGSITITTQLILGLQMSDQLTPKSDITASSELGIDGPIVINTPNIDPSRGLIELPSTFSDPSGQIISGCPADTGDRFVVTGRGGIPHSPSQYLSGRAIWEDTRRLSSQSFSSSTPTNSQLSQMNPPPLIEAQGWVVDKDGTVILTAEPYRGKQVHIAIDFRTCGSQ